MMILPRISNVASHAKLLLFGFQSAKTSLKEATVGFFGKVSKLVM
jgi:hypothetical protein